MEVAWGWHIEPIWRLMHINYQIVKYFENTNSRKNICLRNFWTHCARKSGSRQKKIWPWLIMPTSLIRWPIEALLKERVFFEFIKLASLQMDYNIYKPGGLESATYHSWDCFAWQILIFPLHHSWVAACSSVCDLKGMCRPAYHPERIFQSPKFI